MLTGTELALAIAAVLLGAVGLGALLHWLWMRLAGLGTSAETRLERLSQRLHEAESAREAAEAACRQAEERLAAGERQAEDRLAALGARLESESREREAVLARELAAARAELEAMREGLASARQRIHDLEGEIERLFGESR